MLKVKGYIPKKTPEQIPTLSGSIESVIQTVNDLHTLKTDVIETVDEKMSELSDVIDKAKTIHTQTVEKVDQKLNEFENTALGLIKDIHSLPHIQGEPGKDAEKVDTDALVSEVLSKIPVPEKIDEKSLIKKVISSIPQNKASLKVIHETLDPLDMIEKIMALPEGKVKFKTSQIDGLDQTISAFKNQMKPGVGYVHGGGDTVSAGTNVTITRNANGDKVINATGGGGSGTVTSVSVVSANGFAGTVANPTTTPAITLSTTVTGLLKGNGTALQLAVGNTDYQLPITLTTTGSSGVATFDGTILNIPNYAGGGGTVTSVASADGSITVTNPSTTVDLAVFQAPKLTTARTIGTITGDATSAGSSFNGSANNTNAITLATVNSNVGSFTNASITVNGKGLITAASNGATPEVPLTFSTGLTRTVNTITNNLSTGISGGQTAFGGTSLGDALTLKNYTGASTGFVIDANGLTAGGGSNTLNGTNGLFVANRTNTAGATLADFISGSSNVATVAPTTAIFRGGLFTPSIGATNTQDWTTTSGGLIGIHLLPIIASGASGTINTVIGLLSGGSNQSATATITNYYGVRVTTPIGAGIKTNAAGLTVTQFTSATNNTNILTGTSTIPTGNWNIYSSTAYNNYLGTGRTLIGSTTDDATNTLQVNGTAALSSIPAASSGLSFLTSASLGSGQLQYRSPSQVLTDIGGAAATGSTAYIQNGTSAQTSSNFNIDGIGVAGTALSTPTIYNGTTSTNTLTLKNYSGSTNTYIIDANGLTAGGGASTTNTPFDSAMSMTNPSASTRSFFGNDTIIRTTNGATNHGSLTAGTMIGSGNTANWTGNFGLYGGYYAPGFIAGATGTVTQWEAMVTDMINPSAMNITNAYILKSRTITNSGGGTITGLAGIALTAQTVATNNTYYLSGTSSIPLGNWNLYGSTGYNNYLGTGNTLINTTTDDTINKLQVNGGLSVGAVTITDGNNIIVGNTTGTKIGTATSQKLGFFNATPVVQQTGDISTGLSNLGLITSGTLGLSSIGGLGTGVATFLGIPSSANLAAAMTDETGTGALVFANTPTLVTPNIGAAKGDSLIGNTTLQLSSANGSSSGSGKQLLLSSGNGGATTGAGGNLTLQAGNATGGTSQTGGNIILTNGQGFGGGANGAIKFNDVGSGVGAIFNTASLSSGDKTFTFPNQTGTFQLTGSTTGVSAGPASSTTQTITHGLGRMPAIIRLTGISQMVGGISSGYPGHSEGRFSGSGNTCVFILSVPGGGTGSGVSQNPSTSTSFAIRLDDGSSGGAVATGVVGNITSTTFDIVWTVSGGSLANTKFLWEAQ